MGIFDFLRGKNEEEEKLVKTDGDKKTDRFLEEMSSAFTEKGKKLTKAQQEQKRIDFELLHKCYRLDETTFRCVNFYAQQVIGPDFYFTGKNKEAIKLCEEFKERTHLLLKLEDVVRDQAKYGNGWLELMEANGKLVDIAYIDGRCMDFKRTNEGYVEEDKNGNITGYEFKTEWKPEGVPLEPKHVAHFSLFGGNNELGYGFIEPLYYVIFDKLNVRQGISQGGWRFGFPLTVAYIGDKGEPNSGYQGHKSTVAQTDTVSDALEDIQSKHKLVLPYWIKIEQLKPEKIEFGTLLQYFDERIAGTFGIPLELIGTESKGNKASFEVITTKDLDRTIKSWQSRNNVVLINSMFSRLCLENEFKIEDVPKIVWNNITPPDISRRAKRLTEYINAGVLTPEDVKEAVCKEEEIPYKPTPKGFKPPMKINLPFAPKTPLKANPKKWKKLAEDMIRLEEAIISLKKIKISFPTDMIMTLVDEIIQNLMLQAINITIPTETGGQDQPSEQPEITPVITMQIEMSENIGLEEALLLLDGLKKNYPSEVLTKLIDDLIQCLLLKSDRMDIPIQKTEIKTITEERPEPSPDAEVMQ